MVYSYLTVASCDYYPKYSIYDWKYPTCLYTWALALVLCNKPIYHIGFAKNLQYRFWKAVKMNIEISLTTTL